MHIANRTLIADSLQKIVKYQNYPKVFIKLVKFGTQKLQNYIKQPKFSFMKKIILLVLMSFMSFLGYSQLTENFEGTAVPDGSGNWVLNSGTWKILDNGVGSEHWRAISAPLFTYQGTGRSAYVNLGYSTPGEMAEEWLVMPRMAIRTNEQLRFFTRQQLINNQGTLYEVRVSQNADPTVRADYQTIRTYTELELNQDPIPYNQYNEKLISLNSRAGQNLYIAFVKVYTQPGEEENGDGWLIDNVQLALECPRPSITAIPNPLTTTTANLLWNGSGASYEIEYGPFGFTRGTGITVTSTTNSKLIDSLLEGTRYEFYVRAICSDGNTSEWSVAFFFDTLNLGAKCAEPIEITEALPYSHQSNTLVYGNWVGGTTPGSASTCGGSGNYLESLDVVYRYVATETGLISISMNPFGVGNTGLFVYNECSNIGTTCLAGVANANGSIRNIPSFNVTEGEDYYIVISSRDLTFNFEYYLLIQKVSCAAPLTGTATATTTTATLNWTMPTGNTATEWQVAVQPAGAAVPSDATPRIDVTGGTPTTSVDQLTAGTPYQFWVRANCGNGTFSAWAGPFLFTTSICEEVDKCTYTFTLSDTGSDGWEGGRMEVRQNGVVLQTLGAQITGGGPTVVNVAVCPNVPLQLFWTVAGTTPGEIRINIKNRFNQQLYAMTTSSANLVNTVLYSESSVDCVNPRCLAPVGLAVPAAQLAARSARLTWTAISPTPVGYEIYVVPTGQLAPTESTIPTYTSTTNSFDILATTLPGVPGPQAGLNPDTTYQFYVRTVCSVNGPSVWSAVRAFTTLPTCPRPTALTATLPGTNAITLNWTNTGTTATSWQVLIQPAGGPVPTADSTGWFVVENQTPSLLPIRITTQYNLLPDTDYEYYVRGNCGDLNGLSNWSAVRTFRTLPTCPQPTAFAVNGVPTDTTVNLQWNNNNSSATTWQIIAVPCGGAAPTASTPVTPETTYTSTTTPPALPRALISNLTADTCYEFYIRSICGPADLSRWTGPTTATTQIAPPVCGGVFTDPGGANGNYAANTNSTVIICPNVTGEIVTVTFTSFNTEEAFDGLYIYDGNTVNPAQQISSGNPAGNNPAAAPGAFWGPTANGIGSFTSTTLDGCLTFRFVSDSGGQRAGWVANVTCAPAPTCRQPMAVTTSNPQLNTVDVSWTPVGPGNNFQILAVPCGAPAPTATTLTTLGYQVQGTTFVYPNLTSATCYDFYVRNLCSDTDVSAWSRGIRGVTLVGPLACGGNYVDTGGVLGNYGNNANSIVTICPTNPTDIVIVTFTSFNTEAEYDGLYVYDGTGITAPLIPSTNGPGQGNLNVAGAYWGTQIPGPFESSLAGGCLTFRFRSNSSDTFPGWVSTISCAPAPPCPKPRILTVTDIQQNTAQLGWTESGNAQLWEYIVQAAVLPAPSQDDLGRQSTTRTPSASNLQPGTTYNFYVRAICSPTEKSRWAGPFMFTTKPINDECSGALQAIVNQNLNCIQTVPGSLFGATNSTPTTTCGGGAADDVWYTFTATAETHIVSFSNLSADVDLNYAVYRGACGSLVQQSCNLANNLTPGTTYFMRVFSGSNTRRPVTFNLCIGTLPCTEAPAFCTGQVVTYENAVGIPSLGDIGCLSSTPNPAFFFLQVNQAGPLTYSIIQRDFAGGGLDVDYVAWGPFPDLTSACNAIPENPLPGVLPAPDPSEGCPSSLHACSYDPQDDELMCIPNAQLCDVYVLMITNYSDDPGMITFTQTNADGGTTACFPINTFNYDQTTYCQDGVDPTPRLNVGAAAGTYNATPAGLVIDPVTGTVDLSASAPGVYQVVSTTLTSTGGACTNIPSITTTRTIIVTLAPNSVTNPTTIAYAAAGAPAVFCNGIDEPQAVIRTGSTAGNYSLATGETGLSLDYLTGEILPIASQPGVYHVEYTIPENGGCPAFTTTAEVTIVAGPVVNQPINVKVCESYTLPALTVGTYYTAENGPNGTGQVITSPITETQTVYIYATDGTCSIEKSFLVEINVLPDTPTADLTQPTCSLPTGTAVVTSPGGSTIIPRSDLFISEVTDAATGSLTYVEIFNGTGASVNLANYKLRFYNNGNATTSTNCDFALSGTLANNAVYVVAVGSNTNQGGVVPNRTVAACGGVNTDDHIKLTTSTDVPVDVWGRSDGVNFTPLNQTGYVYQRLNTATAPSLTWNPADWTAIDPEVYTNVGMYDNGVASIYEYSLGGTTYQSDMTFAGLAPGEYDLYVRNIQTGCVSLAYHFVINPDPSSSSVTTFTYSLDTICQGSAVTLTPDTTTPGFTTGGNYTVSPTTGLTIDATTGVIDIASSAPGVYTVKYEVLANVAICQAAGSSEFIVTINSVNAVPVTDFTYPVTICQSVGTVSPTPIAGFADGGTYSYDQTSGLALNTATGVVDLTASTPGTYTVTYGVPENAAICQAAGSTPFTFTIVAQVTPVTTFSYNAVTVCQGATTVLTPDTATPGFTTGGTYTVNPTTGLTVDPVTGVVNTTGALPGTYQITYEVAPVDAICQIVGRTVVTVEIKPVVNAVTAFGYSAPSYCGNVNDPSPIPSIGFTTGGTFAASSADLVINASTGVIDLSASVPGNYTITYTVNSDATNCLVGNTSPSVSVTIAPAIAVITDFTYPMVVCKGDANPTPTLAAGFTYGGTFAATPQGLSIDPSTGLINLAASTLGVTYTVTYTIEDDPSICRARLQSRFEITLANAVETDITGECVNNEFVLTANHNYGSATVTYQWLNSLNAVVGNAQTLVVTTPGQYTVNIGYDGCTGSDVDTFNDIACTIQKGISPKGIGAGDGKNDYFDLAGMNLSKIEIFNRYGTKVYSQANYKNEWYGQSDKGDELPDGTYYYVLEFNSGIKSQTGWIYINREK